MTDTPQHPDDDRPRPRYGEYAPEGWTPPMPPQQPPATPPSGETTRGARAPFGEVLREAFTLAWTGRGTIYWVTLAVAFVASWVSALGSIPLQEAQDSLVAEETTTLSLKSVQELLDAAAASILPSLVAAALTGIVFGILVLHLTRVAQGAPLSPRQLWAEARPILGTLVAWNALYALIEGVLAYGALAWAKHLMETTDQTSLALGVLPFFALGVAVAVLGLIVTIRLVLIDASIAVRRRRLFAAVRESWRGTAGSSGTVLGLLIVVGLTLFLITIPLNLVTLIQLYSIAPALADLPLPVQALLNLETALSAVVSVLALALQASLTAVLARRLLPPEGADLS